MKIVKIETFPLSCVAGEEILEGVDPRFAGDIPYNLAWRTEVHTTIFHMEDGRCLVFDGLLIRDHILVDDTGEIAPHVVLDSWELHGDDPYEPPEMRAEILYRIKLEGEPVYLIVDGGSVRLATSEEVGDHFDYYE